ncbi:hypothetical protein CQY20_29920 [Mycolicibacterium agri]|uniref:Uncharacterized protein n=1 Tax=Mycolicibacterium agri TaxID=36811 RepID=A0A2A7MQ10_MYCAG|nr:hypothetical protein [Mycolicibacterium agri]PEG33607.1 hypothetical protein CQY20_29920 [Mycolicibacterium agri]GFG51917.1 hypothetical protein MAGR_33580 [Mycolicibacterium agri]
MKFKPTWPVLASALVAAVGLASAPTAAAAPAPLPKICLATIAATTCQSPGNVEITGSTPAIDFYPYGTMPFLLGGN